VARQQVKLLKLNGEQPVAGRAKRSTSCRNDISYVPTV